MRQDCQIFVGFFRKRTWLNLSAQWTIQSAFLWDFLRPERPVSVHQGQHIPCWFDTVSLPPSPDEFDEAGISESVATIDNLIQSQVQAGIDSQHIVLLGFSQGAALSMMVALTRCYRLGGAISLSGWIPPRARHVRCDPLPKNN